MDDLSARYPDGRSDVVRRGQLKLKAGVTTMRILGDGYYALAYCDDIARWEVVGPRTLAAGLHVNGPNGYVSGGIAARLDSTRLDAPGPQWNSRVLRKSVRCWRSTSPAASMS